jgi:KAP family P-loop domain
MTQTDEQIWQGDMLDRKSEAQMLIGYLESVAAQPSIREDAQGFTMAIDAGYGEGKTWFLKRLAQQLANNHPVAFVDAWRDDLADDPLTALVATLKKALAPVTESQPNVANQFSTVMSKTGAVAKIVAKGLFKTALKMAITKEGVEALEAVVGGAPEALTDTITDGVSATVDGVAQSFNGVASSTLMEARVADFEAGQEAIEELRQSLKSLVSALAEGNLHAPIFIIIDELDRCRPTYAVKLLEEVKHLFDVPGLVFIFGMHQGQLAHSVKAAYGADFDGYAYLNRFIQRNYRLKEPELGGLVRSLLNKIMIPDDPLGFPTAFDKLERGQVDRSWLIAFYLRAYACTARDTISIIQMLQTCYAIGKNRQLFMPLLLPLMISKLKGALKHSLVQPRSDAVLNLRIPDSTQPMHFAEVANKSAEYRTLGTNELQAKFQDSEGTSFYTMLQRFGADGFGDEDPNSLFNPRNYGDLIETVQRFDSPSNATS